MNNVRTVGGALLVSLVLGSMQIAHATVYTLKNKDDAVFGEDQTVTTVYEDSLYDLAAKYSLGSEEIIRVNPGLDPWIPGADKEVSIPGRHILPPGPRDGRRVLGRGPPTTLECPRAKFDPGMCRARRS